jgi:hypothetical protein
VRQATAARFDDLMARHPEAFADHAAEFWLGPGGDPKKALALARTNLQVRRTPAAYALLIKTARAAGDEAEACRTAGSPEVADFPGLRDLARETAGICGGTSTRAQQTPSSP